ncbi:MAG TPA: inositol monophosphatase family protein [Urbifossiella sp.]|nr:inositol monophosphatase family protein [Urbifossiella sp.]
MNFDATRLSEYLEAATAAARRAAEILESWRSRFSVKEKARADLVTEADQASQDAIKALLLGRFPDHRFLGEEESTGLPIESLRPPADAPPTWVVDPLDGTANYVHDVPAYCISIGLWAERRPVLGVILDPRLNELFTATAGGGAFLNGKPMRVSSVPIVRDGLIATGFPANIEKQRRNLGVWAKVSDHAQALRRNGSSALSLAYVAAGRFDGYWAFDNWPWDVVAGFTLIQEAGGQVTCSDGSACDPFRSDSLTTNGALHAELLRILLESGAKMDAKPSGR